jgi:cyclophilin family peptidyl-prolyl cis-trans isomerase
MTFYHRLLFVAIAPSLFAQAPRPNGLYATLETSMGNITFELFEKETPVTVKNFTNLATGKVAYTDPRNGLPSKLPLYNGLTFHRVIPGFMIQGGDPLGDGTGGTNKIVDEFKPELTFDRPGRIGMANAGPNTGSCQFFITESEQPHLNQLHTVFGQVVEGQDVVTKIAGVPAQADKPLEPVTINKVTIQRVGPNPNAPAPPPVAPVAKPQAPVAKKAATKK